MRTKGSGRPRAKRSRLYIALAVAGLAAGCGWFLLGIGLETALVHETPLEKADAVTVGITGGVLDEAVRLYRQGYARFILVTQPIPERYRGVQAPVTTYQFIREDLRKAGVPDEAVLHFDSGSNDLVQSQLAFRRFLRQHSIRSYISQPVRLHSRLSYWIHRDTFPDGEVKQILWCSDGRLVPRKEILGLHNTLIRMLYWKIVHAPRLREAIAREKESTMTEPREPEAPLPAAPVIEFSTAAPD